MTSTSHARASLQKFVASLMAAAAVSLALGCGGGAGGGGSSQVFVFGRNKDAVRLDPAVVTDGMSLNATRQMLEGLARYKQGSFDVEPAPRDLRADPCALRLEVIH